MKEEEEEEEEDADDAIEGDEGRPSASINWREMRKKQNQGQTCENELLNERRNATTKE